MSDRLPGSSWDNPIWHGKWRIFLGHPEYGRQFAYEFVHDDYDGAPDANDNRAGHAESVEACREEIDERETPTPALEATSAAGQDLESSVVDGATPQDPLSQNRELVEALKPFDGVLVGEGTEDYPDDAKVTVTCGRSTHYALRLGDFRRLADALRTALSNKESQP